MHLTSPLARFRKGKVLRGYANTRMVVDGEASLMTADNAGGGRVHGRLTTGTGRAREMSIRAQEGCVCIQWLVAHAL